MVPSIEVKLLVWQSTYLSLFMQAAGSSPDDGPHPERLSEILCEG